MIDWGKLYQQGRCKALGVPWSEEDKEALASGVPADWVRRGCLSVSDWKKAEGKEKAETEKDKKIPLTSLSSSQLLALCSANGIEATPDAPRPALLELLTLKGVPKRVPVESVPSA